MEKRYYVNIDYEFELFDPNYSQNKKKYKRYNNEFEHLFLWIASPSKVLSSKIKYEQSYLNYIKKIRGEISPITSDEGTTPWWGHLKNCDQARYLNSKETSFNLAKKFNLLPEESFLIKEKADLKKIEIKLKNFYIKSLYSFSGMGNKKVSTLSEVRTNPPYIIEPYYNIVKEFGVTYENDNAYLVKTIQNDKGNFSGGLFNEKFDETEFILNELSELSGFLKQYQKDNSFEIDCFFYQDKNELKFRPCVEINFRKTMTYFIAKLATQLNHKLGLWKLFENNYSFKSHSDIQKLLADNLYSREKSSGILPISPVTGKYISFYFIQENENKIKELVYDLEKKLKKYSNE